MGVGGKGAGAEDSRAIFDAGGERNRGGAGTGAMPSTNGIAVTTDGNIGIGTNTPAAKLHLLDSVSASHRIETSGGTNAWARIELANADGQWNIGTSRNFNSNQLYFARGTTGPLFSVETSGDAIAYGAGGQQAYMGGNADGDVEFGSKNPSVTLAAFYNPASGRLLNTLARDASVRVLTIYGGSDLAEPFAMSHANVAPGTVVVIDPENPGKLRPSARAYDKKVAGIVSGANGVRPGISMTQEDTLEAGENVALSGRVYVQADATGAPIEPGDLLTTSNTAGHAMKVTEHARAQGAVLGKAMTPLAEGTGMVLVLVTLQ